MNKEPKLSPEIDFLQISINIVNIINEIIGFSLAGWLAGRLLPLRILVVMVMILVTMVLEVVVVVDEEDREIRNLNGRGNNGCSC